MSRSRSSNRAARRRPATPAQQPQADAVPVTPSGQRRWLPPALLTAITLLTFSPVFDADFVNYDDPKYVTENAHVRPGLTRDGLSWGLTTTYFGNWHPLVWWSLMLDSQLYGPRAAGYHATNLLWHLGSVLLLYAALRRMTGSVWPSAVTAALFAIHPLNVEPVAWVAERKGVISTFFWMLTLWCYARYAERPGLGRYLLVVLGLVLGLMAKPMLLTLPFVLLLLDYWPLRRFGTKGARRLVAEKLPLLAVVVAFGVVATFAQGEAGALLSREEIPLESRLKNAVMSYVLYLGQALRPANMVPFYPHAGNTLPTWPALGAAALLLILTAAALWGARRAPYLAVGWFWYLGTLVPVIGLVQIGSHARADRYAYVPLVGLFLAAVWGAAEFARRRHVERAAAWVAGLAVVSLMLTSWAQAHVWRDSVALWQHSLEAVGDNSTAHTNLASAHLDLGDYEQTRGHYQEARAHSREALAHYQEAVRLAPQNPAAHNNVGRQLLRAGKNAEAGDHFRRAIQIEPRMAVAHNNLGLVLRSQGENAAAAASFEEALRLDPNLPQAHHQLGLISQTQGRWQEAADHWGQAIALQPGEAEYHRERAFALRQLGKADDSAAEYRESLRLDPGWPQALTDLAWAKATYPDPQWRDGKEALRLAQQVAQAAGDREPQVLDVLAAAYAENGQFKEAVGTAEKAQSAATATRQTVLAQAIDERLRLYRKGQPYHEPLP